MKVLLINIDSKRMPNLALMKIEKYHQYMTMQNFGEVIEIEHEHTVKAKIEMIPIDYEYESKTYPDAIEQCINNYSKTNVIKRLLREHPDRKSLIFVKHIEHGNKLSQELGLPFIYGKTKTEERTRICDGFRGEEFRAIIVSSIFYFGVDIPEVDLIIFAHIGKSYINVVQAVGRGMRDAKGKNELLIYDFYDKDGSYLEKHSKERIKHYVEHGYMKDELAN